MDSMFVLLDAIVLGCGVYILYAYYLMKVKGEVKENLLLNPTTPLKRCKDKKAYMEYMGPRLLALGIGALICGGAGLINDYTNFMGSWYLAITVVFLVLVIWFAVAVKKSVKKFW